MSVPLVSVCIISYNHEKYIKETINSVLSQSFQDFEIIIHDDCSTDNSIDVIKSINDSRIRLFSSKKNYGPSVNSNLAIAKAKSDIVVLIASDDVMHKHRIEECYKFMVENQNIDAVFTKIKIINSDGKFSNDSISSVFQDCEISRSDMLRRFFMQGNFLCAPSVTFRKDIVQKLGGFNPCFLQLQDFDLWVKMLINGCRFGFINKELTYYRVLEDGGNLSMVNSASEQFSKFGSKILFETSKILDNFLEMSFEDFSEIFDEDLKNLGFDNIHPDFKEFYIANLALLVYKNSGKWFAEGYNFFAKDILYKLLIDKEKSKFLEDNFNYSFLEFYKTNSETRINFNVKDNRFNKLKRSCRKRLSEIKIFITKTYKMIF